MKADTVKNKKKISFQTAKEIAGQSGLWMAAATMIEMPRHMAATTKASARLCFSTISAHRS